MKLNKYSRVIMNLLILGVVISMIFGAGFLWRDRFHNAFYLSVAYTGLMGFLNIVTGLRE